MNKIAPKECAQPDCTESYVPHRWGAQAAHNAGWFHQRDGFSWCPQHTPEWVAEWRRKKADAQ